jgi:AraC-like DNA-binding protein
MPANQKNTVTPILFEPPEAYSLDIEVLSLSEFKSRLKDTVHETQRPFFYMLFVVERGDLIHFVDFMERRCLAHDYLLIKPNQIHRFSNQFDWDGWVLIFSAELLLNSKEEEILYQLPTTFSMSRSLFDACVTHLKSMSRDTELNAPKNQLNALLRHQLSSLILRLRLAEGLFDFNLEADSIRNARFNRFRLLLESHFSTEHQVGFYAAELGLSLKTLNRLCLQIVNASAKSLISERVILEAKRLLVHTTESIQSIGETLGFDETSNFIKVFKKSTQLTPRQFRSLHNTATLDD